MIEIISKNPLIIINSLFLKLSTKLTSFYAPNQLIQKSDQILIVLYCSSEPNQYSSLGVLKVSHPLSHDSHVTHSLYTALRPYKYAGYPMLIKTIERETGDEDLFSKSAPILTAASEVAYHTMNNSALNSEELCRENGIPVSGCTCTCFYY